jgi:NhaA family Na+:H+ antiporter
MATDVAFALGLLAVLGERVPAQLKVLLLGLAIVDDVGAIVIIAAFYSTGLHAGWLAAAAAGLVVVALLRRARVRYMPIYVACGTGIWFATFESGVHATIAGVALGLLTPARPFLPEVDADRIAGELSADDAVTAEEVRDISFRIRESIPTTERLQELLHPWTSYLIVPLFALANAGITISAKSLGQAATSPITLGVVAGLVVGKLVGVSGGIALAVRLGLGRLPEGVTMRQVAGMAGVAGIGFTVSIFVAGLAFVDPSRTDQAILGVLVASLLAGSLGSTILLTQSEGERYTDADNQPTRTTGAAGPTPSSTTPHR